MSNNKIFLLRINTFLLYFNILSIFLLINILYHYNYIFAHLIHFHYIPYGEITYNYFCYLFFNSKIKKFLLLYFRIPFLLKW